MERDLEITTGSFMSLYAWYSWPNVVLCWCGGILIDRVLGLRLGAIVFAGFVTSGQVCMTVDGNKITEKSVLHRKKPQVKSHGNNISRSICGS